MISFRILIDRDPRLVNWVTDTSVFMIASPIDGSSQIAAILRDVTLQQAYEQQLRMFEALVEYAAVGMALTDLKGNYIYANAALSELSGYGDAMRNMNISQPFASEGQPTLDS